MSFGKNYRLPEHPQFSEAMQVHAGKRRIGRASAVPAGTTFIVSNFPAFAGAIVVNVGGNGTAATNGDSFAGSFVFANTGTTADDSVKVVTATAATRRDWNPRCRMKFQAPQAITNVRYHVGLFSADPSAIAGDGLGAGGLSCAVLSYDTGVDTGGVGYWFVETGNAVADTRVQTTEVITAGYVYELEIRLDSVSGRVEFWLANHGAAATAVKDVPMRLIYSTTDTPPAATTPLLIGVTATNLGTVTRRAYVGEVVLIQD